MRSFASHGRARVGGAACALGALAAAIVAGCGPRDPAFASRPYVQDVSAHAAVVAMVTAGPARLRVEVTPDGAAAHEAAAGGGEAAPLAVAEEDAPARLHGLRFEGLAADTRYRYRVLGRDGGELRGAAAFRTLPLPGARAVRFAVFGDTGRSQSATGGKLGPLGQLADKVANRAEPGRQGLLARLVLARDPDLCLHTGDVVYPDGARKYYAEAFFRPFGPLIAAVPLFPVIGNHDVKSEGGAPFDDVFHTPANNPAGTDRYYSFDAGDVHFVALDVETEGAAAAGSPQLAWLADDLARSRASWKVCFFHVPPFSDGRGGDSAALQRTLVPMFESLGVDLVLSGHDHNYQRFLPIRGVTYVVTGGGGVSTYSISKAPRAAYAEPVYHYVLGTADARTLTLEAVDLAGQVFDAVTLAKDAPPR